MVVIVGNEQVAVGIGPDGQGAVETAAPGQNRCVIIGGRQLADKIDGERRHKDVAARIQGDIARPLKPIGVHGTGRGIGRRRSQLLHLAAVAVNDEEVFSGVDCNAARVRNAACCSPG